MVHKRKEKEEGSEGRQPTLRSLLEEHFHENTHDVQQQVAIHLARLIKNDPDMSNYSLNRLESMGETAVPTLIKVLNDSEFSSKVAVAILFNNPSLVKRGSEDAKSDAKELKLKKEDIDSCTMRLRCGAADMLGEIGMSRDFATKEAIASELLKSIKNDNCGIKSHAIPALGKLGDASHIAASALLAIAHNKGEQQMLRHDAIIAVSNIHSIAETAAIHFLSIAKDVSEPESTRRLVIEEIGSYGCSLSAPIQREAVAMLIDCLSDQSNSVRDEAVKSLIKMGEIAVTPLLDILKGAKHNSNVRTDALRALFDVGRQSRQPIRVRVIARLEDILSMSKQYQDVLHEREKLRSDMEAAVKGLEEFVSMGSQESIADAKKDEGKLSDRIAIADKRISDLAEDAQTPDIMKTIEKTLDKFREY